MFLVPGFSLKIFLIQNAKQRAIHNSQFQRRMKYLPTTLVLLRWFFIIQMFLASTFIGVMVLGLMIMMVVVIQIQIVVSVMDLARMLMVNIRVLQPKKSTLIGPTLTLVA
ncbi:hypothetical protein KR100_15315 [Synechococcus sp. KORDI-100]|nr:hypothetical protein KR100_15315 [Synechococcus sp. KORDI-100]